MKKLTVIIVSAILSIGLSNAQVNNLKYRQLNIPEKLQSRIGENFVLVSLYLANIDSDSDFKSIQDKINLDPSYKEAKLGANGELRIAVNKPTLGRLEASFKDMGLEILDYPISEVSLIPEDFPKYADTGNPKQDKANYHEAKQKWIKNNPDRFEAIKHLNLDK